MAGTVGAIIFTPRGAGRVTVDGFPEEIAVSDDAVRVADERHFWLDRATRRLRVSAANGEAEYLMFLEADARTWRGHRLYSRLDAD